MTRSRLGPTPSNFVRDQSRAKRLRRTKSQSCRTAFFFFFLWPTGRSATLSDQNQRTKRRDNFQPNTSNFLTREKKKKPNQQNKSLPEPAFMPPTNRGNSAPSSYPCFPEGPTVRHPDVADDAGPFPGGDSDYQTLRVSGEHLRGRAVTRSKSARGSAHTASGWARRDVNQVRAALKAGRKITRFFFNHWCVFFHSFY